MACLSCGRNQSWKEVPQPSRENAPAHCGIRPKGVAEAAWAAFQAPHVPWAAMLNQSWFGESTWKSDLSDSAGGAGFSLRGASAPPNCNLMRGSLAWVSQHRYPSIAAREGQNRPSRVGSTLTPAAVQLSA